jgi:hypothetical protein
VRGEKRIGEQSRFTNHFSHLTSLFTGRAGARPPLMTHTSGVAYGDTSSQSDYEFMKEQVAAGTTHLGQYSSQNMNFGLCRILISTINGNIPVDWSFPLWPDLRMGCGQMDPVTRNKASPFICREKWSWYFWLTRRLLPRIRFYTNSWPTPTRAISSSSN